MGTHSDIVNGQFGPQTGVHFTDYFRGYQAVGYVRLVGDHDNEKARLLEAGDCAACPGQKAQILKPPDSIGLSVPNHGSDDDTIPIKKNRPPPRRFYHFVDLRCRAGWDTRQCQTTA